MYSAANVTVACGSIVGGGRAAEARSGELETTMLATAARLWLISYPSIYRVILCYTEVYLVIVPCCDIPSISDFTREMFSAKVYVEMYQVYLELTLFASKSELYTRSISLELYSGQLCIYQYEAGGQDSESS